MIRSDRPSRLGGLLLGVLAALTLAIATGGNLAASSWAFIVESVRVLMLTTFDLDAYVYSALRDGASGFLLKDTPPAGPLSAITVVAAGDGLLAPSITRRPIAEFARLPDTARSTARALDGVTVREQEVLGLIARGLSNAEIAEHLHLGQATIKTHVGRLLFKLTARDRAQLVIIAYESGLVRPAL
ncbi:response regulator transcription factor [Amycolatopsis sp. H20-H5]|uniref:response regulator transcription factor n=1 Tax=Amycolatopsis sp. H20-H5 TaxID=3046309 RepID=UPI002DBAE30A|nr:response regulator transcription factor [Amycolatopsis sp. H20-H5]MEC3978111.1 response regulator transcription factor [Amycolatopsis sp. H20-H5]